MLFNPVNSIRGYLLGLQKNTFFQGSKTLFSITVHFVTWCFPGNHSNNNHHSDDYVELYFSTVDAAKDPLKKPSWI